MDLETLHNLIGDIPVSEQICEAITHHNHSGYATHDEVEELKQKINMLLALVGDISVADQIAMALNNIK